MCCLTQFLGAITRHLISCPEFAPCSKARMPRRRANLYGMLTLPLYPASVAKMLPPS